MDIVSKSHVQAHWNAQPRQITAEPLSPSEQVRCSNCQSMYFPEFSQTDSEDKQCSLDCRTMNLYRTSVGRFRQRNLSSNNYVSPRQLRSSGRCEFTGLLLGSDKTIQFSSRGDCNAEEPSLCQASGLLKNLLRC